MPKLTVYVELDADDDVLESLIRSTVATTDLIGPDVKVFWDSDDDTLEELDRRLIDPVIVEKSNRAIALLNRKNRRLVKAS